MRIGRMLLAAAGGLAGIALQGTGLPAMAAEPVVALAGTVSAGADGALEGVVVSAKRENATTTVSVVTDAQGHYGFPSAKLAPGHYFLSIRAIGYELDGAGTVDLVADRAASADLSLRKTKRIAQQLSSAEWLASMPGNDGQKKFLLNCLGCHTLQRIVTSTHDASEFKQVLDRMTGYYPGSTPIHPQRLVGDFRRDIGNGANFDAVAKYLASVNLSEATTWEYPLVTLPRVTGRSTRVVVTEYDLPRPTIEPHDVLVDADGMVWYSDFGGHVLGRLDPATGKVTEYPIPETKPGYPVGTLDLEPGNDGELWISLMYQAGLARFDKHAGTFKLYPVPKEWQADGTQLSMVSSRHVGFDGKVWTKDVEKNATFRLDVATGTYENWGVVKDPSGKGIGAYGIPSDSHNNMYLLNFGGAEIGRLDAKTKQLTIYPTPTPGSRPRRGRVDAEDRLWFAEYGGNAIAMFDPKTETIKEWKVPTAWTAPYDAAPARNGEVWTASMLTDRVVRIDTKSGDIVEYPLPHQTNIRRVFVDERTTPNRLWLGNAHGAAIVMVEPLD